MLPPKKLFWEVEEHWKWKWKRSNENIVGHNVSCLYTGVNSTVKTNLVNNCWFFHLTENKVNYLWKNSIYLPSLSFTSRSKRKDKQFMKAFLYLLSVGLSISRSQNQYFCFHPNIQQTPRSECKLVWLSFFDVSGLRSPRRMREKLLNVYSFVEDILVGLKEKRI